MTKRMGRNVVLSEVKDIPVFQRVNVVAKALRMEEITEVPGGKRKQDVIVADSTGTIRFTVWEVEIGKIEVGKSYELSGIMVREFPGKKFLSTSKEKSNIKLVQDVGEVTTEVESEENADLTSASYVWVRNVCIVEVMHLEKYRGCLKCKTKLVPNDEDPDLRHCSKCAMVQCLDGGSEGLIAQLMVASGAEKLSLCAFGKIVESIAEKPADDVSMGTLLKAKPFKMIHVDGIIQSVSRKP